MNNPVNEIAMELSCQIERTEAIQVFLEEVIEVYSVIGMTVPSAELQTANLKLTALSSFLERELKDMNCAVNKLLTLKSEEKER